jgi:hypothetical protein
MLRLLTVVTFGVLFFSCGGGAVPMTPEQAVCDRVERYVLRRGDAGSASPRRGLEAQYDAAIAQADEIAKLAAGLPAFEPGAQMLARGRRDKDRGAVGFGLEQLLKACKR